MTDKELADQADFHFRRTTISYPEWVKRKNAGRYVPADGSGTEWGKAFAALNQIQGTADPPPPAPYTVAQNVVGGGGAVSGTFGWAATPSDLAATNKVEFLVDDVVKATDTAEPYSCSLDTTTLTNGAHTWIVKATASDGRVATDTQTVTTDNPAVPPPPPAGVYILAWDTYADVPAKYGSDTPYVRVKDVTLATMPPGVTTCMEILADGSDSTSNTGDGTYLLNVGGSPEAWITEGAETWESFYMAVPDGTNPAFPGTWKHSVISSGWNAFYEYHEPGIAPRSTILGAWGSDPPVWQLAVAGGSTSSPTDVWVRGPQIVHNKWLRFLFHWRWSRQNAGYCEAWIDGVPWVTRTSQNVVASWGGPAVADNYPNAWNVNGATRGGYFEIGHYRGPSRTDVEKTYLAKIRVASTRELALA
jgi:hypothetical protein